MSTYVIGDIQGCYQSFRKLLNKIKFEPKNDHLILAGDLINRGPQSLETMQYILAHQTSISCVLGNHDLHFLAIAHHCLPIGKKDTFSDILDSHFCEKIVSWLTNQPLVIYSKQFQCLISHAGLPHHFSAKKAVRLSGEVSKVLKSATRYQFYLSMYGNTPDHWSEELTGVDRLRYITNAFTRMRFCQQDGTLELSVKSAPGKQPSHLTPWFELQNQHFQGTVIFGHWAALQGHSSRANVVAIDTGCVWGGKLTAYCLDDQRRVTVKAVENRQYSF